MKHLSTAAKDSPWAAGYAYNLHTGDTRSSLASLIRSKPGGDMYNGRGGTGDAAQEAKARVIWRKLQAGRITGDIVQVLWRDNGRWFRKFQREASPA